MQQSLVALAELGGLPVDDVASDLSEDAFQRLKDAVEKLASPPSEDETRAACALFPSDDSSCFGLAWGLLHFIESAPDWPYVDQLDDRNWWITFLRERCERGGRLPRT